MWRTVRSRLLVGSFLIAFPAAARTLSEYDAFAAFPPARRALGRPAEAVSLPGTAVHVEGRLGVPTFLRPAYVGERGRVALLGKSVGAERAARAHLLDLAPLWGLTEEDVLFAPLQQVHDVGRGPIIVQLRQEAFGVPVFRDEIRVAMDRSYAPVAIAGYLPSVAGLSRPVFALSAADALVRAGADLGIAGLTPAEVESLGPAPGGHERLAFAAGRRGLLATPARAKRVLFHLPERLEPAWYVEVDAVDGASTDLYAYAFSAADGSLLYRHRLVASDAFSYRVWADTSGLKMPLDGPQGRGGDPYPGTTPDRYQAPFVPPSLVTLSSGPISTKDPWLPAGATETNGNNVDAYADLKSPDGLSAGDFRANVTAPGVFDRTYDTALPPGASDDQRKAAITQLFYVTNFFHDWYYDAGFNEVAGNGQASNYGRGGIEGDAMRAEAQDFAGRDNSNMATPSDGASPRMQMFAWSIGAARAVSVDAPAASAAVFDAGAAAFGPGAFTLSGPVVVADDGAGTPSDACEPIANSSAMAGRIALVDRGTCPFVVKVANAEAAGAAGVVVVNNQGDLTITMADLAGGTALPYTIPALFVGRSDGATLKSLVPAGLAVTLRRERDRDGSIDDQIVAHEWAHFLSNRLVGNANGLSANQAGGLGEGWSDFAALLFTVQPGDAALPGNGSFGGIYPIFGYAVGGTFSKGVPNQGWYFGLRRYPYATDMAIDPLTYAHVMNGVALPAGPAVNAELFGATVRDGSGNSEVHNTGEVWATMLWECYAALLRDAARLTFEQARDRMRFYLVASLKLTPLNPTLLEARDALLAVAFTADHDDHALFVRAFAKRGAGPRAVASPDRFTASNAGVVESYDVGGDLGIVSVSLDDSVAPCDRDGRLDAGETGRLALSFKNRGLSRLSATRLTVSSTNPAVSFPSGTSWDVPVTDPTESTSLALPVALSAGSSGIQSLGFTLTLRDAGMISDTTASFTARGNADDVAGSSASDDVESAFSPWIAAAAPGFDPAASFRRIEVTPFDHRWSSKAQSFVADLTLTSPPIVLSASGPSGFTFRHRYSFLSGPFFTAGNDYIDGAIVEFSGDGGATWGQMDVTLAPGYTETLYGGDGASSPLKGVRAWAGDSPDLPGFTLVTVTFGRSWAGKTVLVRFRRAMEGDFEERFWEIDDIAFTGITNTPFPALVADRGRCHGRNSPVPAFGGAVVKRR